MIPLKETSYKASTGRGTDNGDGDTQLLCLPLALPHGGCGFAMDAQLVVPAVPKNT